MIKKLLLATVAVATVATGGFAEDRNGKFRDFRDYNLSADDFVAQYEGWGFTKAYEEAKVDLWFDVCADIAAEFCSDRLAHDWELQHAAAYLVADAVQNRGKDMDDALNYVKILTVGEVANVFEDGMQYYSESAWDIDNVDDLIEEYETPTSKPFESQIIGVTIDHHDLESTFFLN